MRHFSVHRSSMSRYMGGANGYKRSSIGRRSSYKLGSSTFESYLNDAKRISDDIKASEEEEETDSAKKSSALSKYTRTKAVQYKTSASKFNTGVSAADSAADSFEKLLKDDEPDMEKAYAAAEKFVEGYNDIYASVKASSNSQITGKAKYISTVTDLYSNALSKAGITSDKDGRLALDKEKFMKADKRTLENLFAEKSSYLSHVREQTDSITLISKMSTDTYSDGSSTAYTSAMSGSLFSKLF